jgi:SAM-dependent methyltransferase
VSEVWRAGTSERFAGRVAPVADELVGRLAIDAGDRVLDLATGTGDVALRVADRGATVTAIDVEPMLETARRAAAAARAEIRFDLGDVEHLPYEDRCFDVLASNFGLIHAPDHANVAAELARVSCPGARLGFSAWKPNAKLGALYRRFSEEPIDGREMFEWGREDHVEDMLGEDFDLDFHDGMLWIEARSGEELWELASTSAPPVIALVRRLDAAAADEFHRAFVELYEEYREDGGVRVPRRYLIVLGRRR